MDIQHLLEIACQKIDQQDWSAALLALDRTKRVAPKHPDVLHLSGIVKFQMNSLITAEADLLSAVTMLPKQPEFHNNLANVQRALGKTFEAEGSYKIALDLKPNFVEAYTNYGKLLIEVGRWEEGIKLFSEGELRFPGDCNQSFQLGRAYQYARKLNEASDAYQRCLIRNPKFAEGFNNYGNVLYDLGEKNRALNCYKQALKLSPGYIDAQHNLGSLLPEVGRSNEGIVILQNIITANPHLSATWGNLADAMLDSGRNIELRELAISSLSKFPTFLGPRLALSELLMMEHSIDKALKFMLDDQTFFVSDSSDRLRFSLLIRIAICGWIVGRNDLVSGPVSLIMEQCSPINRAEKNVMVFAHYLTLLVRWVQDNPKNNSNNKPLLLLGDSHALSACGQTVNFGNWSGTVHSRLLMGCKAFHLATDRENKYKISVRKVLNEISHTIPVIICIGEIDCRIEEGILIALKKGRIRDLDAEISTMVNSFVSFIQEIANRRKLIVGYQCVPCPTKPRGEYRENDMQLLIQIVNKFNHALRLRSKREGVLFIDIESLTKGENGFSNKKWNIDSHHLIPSYLQESIDQNFISAHNYYSALSGVDSENGK